MPLIRRIKTGQNIKKELNVLMDGVQEVQCLAKPLELLKKALPAYGTGRQIVSIFATLVKSMPLVGELAGAVFNIWVSLNLLAGDAGKIWDMVRASDMSAFANASV